MLVGLHICFINTLKLKWGVARLLINQKFRLFYILFKSNSLLFTFMSLSQPVCVRSFSSQPEQLIISAIDCPSNEVILLSRPAQQRQRSIKVLCYTVMCLFYCAIHWVTHAHTSPPPLYSQQMKTLNLLEKINVILFSHFSDQVWFLQFSNDPILLTGEVCVPWGTPVDHIHLCDDINNR